MEEGEGPCQGELKGGQPGQGSGVDVMAPISVHLMNIKICSRILIVH